jgi:acetyltransferase-like isoleucine patch superfamily enzyme
VTENSSRSDIGASSGYYPLVPGERVPGDWFNGKIPVNVSVGEGSLINTARSFLRFHSVLPVGFRAGRNCTFSGVTFNVEREAEIEVGDDCFLAECFLIATRRIRIGSRVYVASGATIVDSDFHPLDPGERLWDTFQMPRGKDAVLAPLRSVPVEIADDVWIGFNATILKGVRIGRGAYITPGAVVTRDVPDGASVAGNPAVVVRGG